MRTYHNIAVLMRIVLSASVVFFCSIGCTVPQFPLIQSPPKITKEMANNARAEEDFINGRECDMRQMPQLALRYYESAYELSPKSKILKEILVERYVLLSKFQDAILIIKGKHKEKDLPDSDKEMLAGIYLRMGKAPFAAAVMELVVDKKKDEWFTLGLIYESIGNTAKSLACYEACLRAVPTSVEMALKVGAVYIRQKRYAAAESLYVAAQKRIGQNAQLFNAIGETKMFRGDTTLALDFFKIAMVLDSADLDAMHNAADIYVQKGNYEKAIPLYEKLYVSDPQTALFEKTLALLYYYTHKFEQAKVLINNQLAQDLENAEMHYYLAMVYEEQDSSELAKMEYEKTVVIQPKMFEAWIRLCFLELRKKDYTQALSQAQRFKKALPFSPLSWRTEGYIYNAKKEYGKAIPLLKKAIELDSSDGFSWFELGSALERTKKTDSAVVIFKRILKKNPADAAAANYLGYMWADQGINLDSAQRLLISALSQDSLNGAYLDSYAWVFYKKNEIDSANVYIVKALAQMKDDPVVYAHYGDILLKQGNTASAILAYKKSLELDPLSDEAAGMQEKILRNEPSGSNKKQTKNPNPRIKP